MPRGAGSGHCYDALVAYRRPCCCTEARCTWCGPGQVGSADVVQRGGGVLGTHSDGVGKIQ